MEIVFYLLENFIFPLLVAIIASLIVYKCEGK